MFGGGQNAFPGVNMGAFGAGMQGDGSQQQQQQPNQQQQQQMQAMMNAQQQQQMQMQQQMAAAAAAGGGLNPSQLGMDPSTGTFNPAMLAMLQQQAAMQQQQQGQPQQQQQQQYAGMRYPNQQQAINPANFFNPAAPPNQQQQQAQHTQQQQQQQPQMNFVGQNFNPFAQQQQQQQQPGFGNGGANNFNFNPQQQQPGNMGGFPQQQQQQQAGNNNQGMMPQQGGGGSFDGAALLQGGMPGGMFGMIDPSQQQAQQQQMQGQNFGSPAMPNGVPPHMMQAASPPGSVSGSVSDAGGGEAKAGRKAPASKKKKTAAGAGAGAGQPSGAASTGKGTPQQQHAIPPGHMGPPQAQQHASPGPPNMAVQHAMAEDRARSHTRSPSLSGIQPPLPQGMRAPGMPQQQQQQQQGMMGQQQQQQMGGAGGGGPQPNVPPGWQPSLGGQQQQLLLNQAMQVSKARVAQGQNVQPAQALHSMGYVYVKPGLLPAQVQTAPIPGGGVVLSHHEARLVGLLPNVPTPNVPGGGVGGGGAAQIPQHLQQQQAQQQQLLQAQQHAQQAQQAMQVQPPSTPQQQAGMPPPGFRPSPSAPGGPVAASPAFGAPSSPAPFGMASPAMSQGQLPRARRPTNPTRPESRSGLSFDMSRPPTSDGVSQSFGAQQQQQQQQFAQPGGAPAMPDASQAGQQVPISAAAAGAPLPGQAALPNLAAPPAAAQRFAAPTLPPVQGGPLPKLTKSGFVVADYNTRLHPLPPRESITTEAEAAAAAELWQPLTAEEEAELASVMRKDHEYTQVINAQGARVHAALAKRTAELRPAVRRPGVPGLGPTTLHWWERLENEDMSALGRDGPYEHFGIILPRDKRQHRLAHGGRSTAPLAGGLSTLEDRRRARAAALRDEDLVPIRLEIDHEAWRLRDTFTWNAADDHVGIEHFAHTLCDDFGLPHQPFVNQIRASIQTQVQEHMAAQALYTRKGKAARGLPNGKLDAKDEKWWEEWREDVNARAEGERPRKRQKGTPLGAITKKEERQVAEEAARRAELRIEIKLDITVGAMNLVDRFEWDISDDGASAEAFAEQFAADLGLSGEFKTAIAHSIREQVDVHVRSLALVGHTFDGADVPDEDLRSSFLPCVSLIARSEHEADSHTPRLNQLSEADIDMLERERERESRRKRRQTRGRRGINLPDREPQKTQRTPAVPGLQAANIAAIEAANGGSTGEYSSRMLSTSERAAAGMSTRRAAAVANAHITGMHDFDSTPGPEGPSGEKRASRLDAHAMHFLHPGGLGPVVETSGPRFAPSNGNGGSASRRAKSPPAGLAPELSARAAATAALAAKIRAEDVALQHPNLHEGQWYCSNCGIPGTLASGRRKGPLGDKSLCGPCGKYYHRHRRVKQVKYTRDEAFHRGQVGYPGLPNGAEFDESNTQPTSAADTPAPSGDAATASRGTNGATSLLGNGAVRARNDDEEDEESEREARRTSGASKGAGHSSTRGNSPDLPFQQVGSPDEDDSDSDGGSSRGSSARPRSRSPNKRVAQLARSAAAASASPNRRSASIKQDAAQDVAMTQATPTPAPAVAAAAPPTPVAASAPAPQAAAAPAPAAAAAATGSPAPAIPPAWLSEAAEALRKQYPQDRFELLLRPRPAGQPAAPGAPPEWRVRCQDCPGKLYTPGPEQSLQNFSIHLKNRLHRNNVAARLGTGGSPAPSAPAS